MQTQNSVNWSGKRIGEYTIESLLHENSFAFVVKAISDSGAPKVIRIARSSAAQTPMAPRSTRYLLTSQAAGTETYAPPGHIALAMQIDVLQKLAAAQPGFLETYGEVDDSLFYVMPFYDGQTLEELIAIGKFPLDVFITDVIRKLIDVAEPLSHTAAGHHGNIKPSHIVITQKGLQLLSPGVFRDEVAASGAPVKIALTSPAYYPFLEPDDKLAIGITLFESVCKVHPFAGEGGTDLQGRLTPEFAQMLSLQMERGMPHLSGLLRFRTPREIVPSLSIKAEKYMMRSLRLGFTREGRVEPVRGWSSWEEMRMRLRDVD
ncbi:MAG: serine/threonine-protein kinase [Candidatus Obscuribacterales bacterium]